MSVSPALVQALSLVVDSADGRWSGGATALHASLLDVVRGPLVASIPLNAQRLTAALTAIAGHPDGVDGLTAVRRSPRVWDLSH